MPRPHVTLWLSSSCSALAVVAVACDPATTPSQIPALEASTMDAGMYMIPDAGVDAHADAKRDGSQADAKADAKSEDSGTDAGHDAGNTDAAHDAHETTSMDARTGDAKTAEPDAHTTSDAHGATDAHSATDANPGCALYAAPGTSSTCVSCTPGASGCQANGCSDGKYCHTSTNFCVLPTSVMCGDGGT